MSAAPDAMPEQAPDAALAALVEGARARLDGAPAERLGVVRSAKRMLGIERRERIAPGESVWHLGVLLVRCVGPAREGLLATGEIIRAREEARRGYAAESQRARAARQAAARRGGFAEGEAAHVDAAPIDPAELVETGASGPVSIGPDGTLLIRWSQAGTPVPLGPYLDERIDLLRHPGA